MKDLQNKVVLITGGARGIGKTIAQAFLENGSKVIISDLDSSTINETITDLQKFGEATGFACNVSNMEEVTSLFKFVMEKFTKIDVLINNAGITKDGLFMRMSEQDWDAVISVNLKGVFNCAQQAIKYMVKQKFGNIINISSIIGIVGNPGQANYSASKGAVIALTKTLAREYASRNIRVNAIAPGFIDTAMTQAIPSAEKQKMLESIPLKKLGQPEDIAQGALFLASNNMSNFITAQTLVIDGGMI